MPFARMMAALRTCLRSHRCGKGFSLLELSVVLAIIALVSGGGITILTASLQKRQYDETAAKIKIINNAILDYRRAFNRIPCPADATLAVTSANFGVEAATPGTCTGGSPAANFGPASTYVVEGMVPAKTLRLPDEYAFDGWGRRIMYAVDNRYTASAAFTVNDIQSSANISIKRGMALSSFGTRAVFYGKDTVTKGAWINVYGANGYAVANNATNYPVYATVSFLGKTDHTWVGTATETRALQKAATPSERIASCWYAASSYTISVNVTDDSQRLISLYMLDWDSGGPRSAQIAVTNVATGATLDSRTVTSFYGGHYYSWIVSGNVRFTITNGSSPSANVVASGIFFDDFTESDPAVYAIVSFGKNGHGAYPRAGGSTRINANSSNTDEQENCNCNSAAAATTFNATFVQKALTVDPSNSFNMFDDIVWYKTRANLRSLTE